MDYKARFKPLEIYRNGAWVTLEDPTVIPTEQAQSLKDPISEQVAAIYLPGSD